jgi:hypothetical protein
MNTAYQTPEPFTVPDGGLASFLTATTGSWAEDENITPNGGISNVSRAADQLAQFGRNGDTYMVHAAEGETFVPREVLEANPGLKESLFSQMRSMGVENPERYVVGSGLNSLNPVTGQPEFFLSKAWKSIKGAVKSVVKVLKKAAPIIIPFAIDAFLPGLGSFAAGALGAGIGTLVQGGDIKDAFKSAALGGLAGGAMSGFRNAASGRSFFEGLGPTADPFKVRTDNWMTRTGRDLFGPSIEGTPVTETISSGAPDIFDPNKFTGLEGVSEETLSPIRGGSIPKPKPKPPVFTLNQENQLLKDANIISSPPKAGLMVPEGGNFAVKDSFDTFYKDTIGSGMLGGEYPPIRGGSKGFPTDVFNAPPQAGMLAGAPPETGMLAGAPPETGMLAGAPPETGMLGGEYPPIRGGSKGFPTDVFNAPRITVDKNIYFSPEQRKILRESYGDKGYAIFNKAFANYSDKDKVEVYKELERVLNTKSALSAGKELTKPRGSFFDLLKKGNFSEAFFPREMTVEQLRASLGEKARYLSDDQLKALASRTKPSILAKYAPPLIAGIGGLYAAGGYKTNEGGPTRATREQINKYRGYSPSIRRQMRMAAGGGEMYPERIGAIAGPGTGVSDDVPALLSDGEFVMTAKAVRGAGNGSRDKGVRKMYQMMRRFEGGAV